MNTINNTKEYTINELYASAYESAMKEVIDSLNKLLLDIRTEKLTYANDHQKVEKFIADMNIKFDINGKIIDCGYYTSYKYMKERLDNMTTYEQLREIEEKTNYSACPVVRHNDTNEEGVVSTYGENNEFIGLCWGNGDGSDDTTISIEELNEQFTIVRYN